LTMLTSQTIRSCFPANLPCLDKQLALPQTDANFNFESEVDISGLSIKQSEVLKATVFPH